MIVILRWILLPISLIYSLVIWVRNKMYDLNIFKSKTFKTPTIVIGNLAIGGAGKSPMTEYLIRLLKNKYKIATLSRGYGRKTHGFRLVETSSTTLEVGDEPLQFKRKFQDITVAVCEDRCTGINKLSIDNDLIILDDAYQHRKLNAGINILLFEFNSLFEPHLTLPTGNFRDNFSSTKRADIILITKCPEYISNIQKKHIENTIHKYSYSPIFYSRITYSKPIHFQNKVEQISNISGYDIILFCGIANPTPLINYLKKENSIKLIQFPDHHNYKLSDFEEIKKKYDNLSSKRKIILTTEKDLQRVVNSSFLNYPLYYIPIEMIIEDYDNNSFDYHIYKYLSKGL